MVRVCDLRDENYYSKAHEGSLDLTHPSMQKLLKFFRNKESVLDMGCGEGTRLNLLVSKTKRKIRAVGVDINKLAVQKAKSQYPKLNFYEANLEKLPFRDSQFDLVYSAYVFEHLINPEKVLEEGLRVLKGKGLLIIIAPNFGSPNRRSPNSKENKIRKLFLGLFDDFNQSRTLAWAKVSPKSDSYTIDSDATIEPYLGSLMNYTIEKFKIVYCSSFWEKDRFSLFQLPFRIFGYLNIYPFNLWGPHMMIVLEKN